MTKETKETLEKTIKTLAENAADCDDSNNAMRYGQAVLNVANAFIDLSNLENANK